MTTRYATITVGVILGLVGLAVTSAQALTMKECSAKYKAAKDGGTLNGIKWNDFRKAECGSDATVSPTAVTPGAKPDVAAKPTPKPDTGTKSDVAPKLASTPKPTPAMKPTVTTAAAPTGANQFSTDAEAKAHCPADTVVWANLGTKVYHFSGNKSYGATKKGAYMCEKDATNAAIRAAKNEKHP